MSGIVAPPDQRRARWRAERAEHMAMRKRLRDEIEQLAEEIGHNPTTYERSTLDAELAHMDEQEARLLNMEISELGAMRHRLQRALVIQRDDRRQLHRALDDEREEQRLAHERRGVAGSYGSGQ